MDRRKLDTATRLAPDHSIKKFVKGEEFDLLGSATVSTSSAPSPRGVDQLPTVTADHVLYVR